MEGLHTMSEPTTYLDPRRRKVPSSQKPLFLSEKTPLYSCPDDPSTSTGKREPYPTLTLERENKEINKEIKKMEKLMAYFSLGGSIELRWVPVSLSAEENIFNIWHEVALRVEKTPRRNGKLQQALTKSMLFYLVENEAEALNLITLPDRPTTIIESVKRLYCPVVREEVSVKRLCVGTNCKDYSKQEGTCLRK